MNTYQTLFCCFMALLLSGCTKDFEAINTNPNSPETVPATNLLLSGIAEGFDEAHTMYDGEFGGITFRTAGFWVQYWGEYTQIYDVDKYNFSASTMGFQWRQTYQGPLQDLQVIMDAPENGANMRAAAMVMRAYLVSILTNLFGDIPYAQSNRGAEYPQPVYDTQEKIYKDLTGQLAQAATMFGAGGGDLGAGDVLYNGDWRKWAKFSNSLRARLLNRFRHLDAAAEQELVALLGNPDKLFGSNADNASLTPTGAFPYTHPFYQVNQFFPDYFQPSSTMVELLGGFDDPRIAIYLQPNAAGQYAGVDNGDSQPPSIPELSAFGARYLGNPTLAMHAMTYAELLFIQAEVFEDNQAYLDGIAAAMDLVGTSPTAGSITASQSAWDTNPLDAIISQKWMALFPDANEAFTEYRRTGYPSVIQEALNSRFAGLGIPYRYAYPPIEESTNGANLAQARQRQQIVPGMEVFGSPMWWAK